MSKSSDSRFWFYGLYKLFADGVVFLLMDVACLIISGAIGSIIKDIVTDNKLTLPKKEDGSLLLGCVGGVIVGAGIGFIVDGDPITAFFAGYSGSQIIEKLIPKNDVK